MVQINFASREVSCKIVYYGPGICGKTTNLQQVHNKAPQERRGHLTSIATEGDRTLFFDFMPLELGSVAGMNTKFQLYTVPGQVYYNATRKIVLEGVDGIIFVADSDPQRRQANLESWQNLKDNLAEYGLEVTEVPLVIQFNKRDLPDAMPAEQMDRELNELGSPTFEAVALTGEGVMATLRRLSVLVLEKLNQPRPRRAAARRPPAAAPAAVAATPPTPSGEPGPAAAAPGPIPPAPAPPEEVPAAEPVGVTAAGGTPPAEPQAPVPEKPTTGPEPTPPRPTAQRPRIIVAGEPEKKSSDKLVLVIVGVVVIVVAAALALLLLGGR